MRTRQGEIHQKFAKKFLIWLCNVVTRYTRAFA